MDADDEDEPEDNQAPVVVKQFSAPRLNPPDKFDFSDPAGWTRWSSRWRRFREASGLDSRSDKEQINTLIYTLGEEAEDIVLSRGIAEDNYDTVIDAFNTYFGVRRNLIAERAKFNKMTQGTEAMDVYIHNLYRQAEYCEYQGLREELIRDRIVVGVTDDKLSEKLQAEPDLTLEQAVNMARRYESAKQAQNVVRGQSTADVHANRVSRPHPQTQPRKFSQPGSQSNTNNSNNSRYNSNNNRQPSHTQQKGFRNQPRPNNSYSNGNSNTCKRCGKGQHPRESCPASKSHCNLCGKVGHWRRMCFTETAGQVTEVELFQGEVNSDTNMSKPWMVDLTVEAKGHIDNASFKLDSGAAATVCRPGCITGKLEPCTKILKGPGNIPIPCVGQIEAVLRYGRTCITETVYVVRGQNTNLLSKSACQRLNLLACTIDNVNDSDSNLFHGLGTVKASCEIKLSDDAKPYSIFVPRPVAFPLLEKTKLELDRMLKLGVIEEAKQPTEWCAPMVVVPKGDTVRICTDFTQLNRFVQREIFPMATVEDS